MMDFRAACYCYSQLLQLVCYASRALIIFRFSRNFLGATVTCMLSLSSISLIQNRTNDFCASFAYLRRKALHPSSQSIACANAKLCNRQRKALHAPMQSFAIANAKLCNRQRKALHPPTQSFACFPTELIPRAPICSALGYVIVGISVRGNYCLFL